MRRVLILLILLPMAAMALEQKDINRQVSTAASASSNAYVEARDRIVGMGTNALPFLGQAAVGEDLDWRGHLTARICYERIARGQDIEALRKHDWKQYPPYAPGKLPKITMRSVVTTNETGGVVTNRVTTRTPGKMTSILGPQADMDPYVVPVMKEAGLWYHYLEAYWKKTGEGALPSFDRQFDLAWAAWGALAIENQPEEYYRIRILIQWLEEDKDMSAGYAKEYYRYLREKKIPDAVPVLVERYESYFKREATGMELYPGARNESLKGMFEPILLFADARHADLIEKYIAEHAALAPLKEKVAEIRARPAPPPTPEPPFRLGTRLVILK